MTRRLLLFATFAAGVVLVALLTLPWWLGAAARTIGGHYGVAVEGYETRGYGRWAAQRVTWTGGGTTVQVDGLEAGHPLIWLLRSNRRVASAERWSVVVTPQEPDETTEAGEPFGWQRLIGVLHDVRKGLQKWLPHADLGPGEVSWPGGGLQIAQAQWRERELRATELAYGDTVSADVTLAWPETGQEPIVAELTGRGQPWSVAAQLTTEGVDGRLEWQQQPAEVTARFGPNGWIPEQAEVTASAWRLPAETLRLGQHYAEVSGNVAAAWQDSRGRVRVQANGVPRVGVEAPPLRVQVVASGGRDEVRIEALEIFAPGIEAALGQPITLDPQSQWAVNEAVFHVDAELAELPYEGLRGAVQGEVKIEPAAGTWPRFTADLDLTDGAFGSWQAVQAELAAVLTWPRLDVPSSSWRDGSGTELALNGSVDLSAREVFDATAQGQLSRSTVERWLPPDLKFGQVRLNGQASGPWTALRHQGQGHAAEVAWGPSATGTIDLTWAGEGAAAEVQVQAQVPNSTARIVARVEARRADVTELQLREGDHELFRLAGPASVQWTPAWRVSGWRLTGPAVELAAELEAGAAARFAVEAPRVSTQWMRHWWPEPMRLDLVRNLKLTGERREEVLVFQAAAEAEVRVVDDDRITLALSARGGEDGLRVERLHVLAAGQSIVSLNGQLPIRLRPGHSPAVDINPEGPLVATGNIASGPEFWAAVAEATGVQVEGPNVTLNLGGQWNRPTGTAEVAAQRLAFAGERWGARIPEITTLAATVRGSGAGLEVERLSARIEGQEIVASGQLPLTPEEWTRMRTAPLDYLRHRATARLAIPDADVAAIARMVPGYLAPSGRLQAELQFGPAGEMKGSLNLRGAATRPLGPLGVLQEVQAELVFTGRELELRTVQASMGGQPVRLTGRAALNERGPPKLDLRLTGNNLPLVRNTELLLRADLDLAVTSDERGDGRVTGNVRLRDSLFLAELQDFVTRGGGNRASSRPPYFSVPIEPLNRWQLAVTLQGDRFLRVRTPVMDGTASARFELGGTLGEPRAVGEATVEQGAVRLPFATFAVQQGYVRLTQADPYQPQLELTGTTRRMGYDLRMELSGPASAPRLQFFSSPPLPSEEIVLLVMAGQAPREEVSYTGGQRAMQIGTFLGRGVIGELFGGDGGERLSVTSGERVSRQGRETYRFAYELTERLSLVGEYDEFDSYNAGFRWRLVPRRDPTLTPEEPDAVEN